jgi:hypothetical protein
MNNDENNPSAFNKKITVGLSCYFLNEGREGEKKNPYM